MARLPILIARLVLGGVFVFAAYTKLRHPWMLFAMSINSYQLLPEWAVAGLARSLPWFELALGLVLLAGYQLRYFAAAASGLLLVFFSVMLRSYVKGMGIDCGCFGFGEALSLETLVRDALLLILSLALTAAAFVSTHTRPSSLAATRVGPEGAGQPVK